MGIKELITDIFAEQDTKCNVKDIAEDKKRIAIANGYDYKQSSYFKMGCYDCKGYKADCDKPKRMNFGYLD